MGQYETANILAILAGGRAPQWVTQENATGAPSSDGDGVYLEDSLKALVDVQMREDVRRRTARVEVAFLDLAANYTVTINGTACTATGPFADLDELLADLASAINGSAEPVTASVVSSNGDDDDTVLILGDNEDNYSVDLSATGGGLLGCTADPVTATARIFVSLKGPNAPTNWRMPINCEYALDRFGLAERFDSAGCDRMYVGLYDIAGHADDGADVSFPNIVVSIGPCVTE